MRVAAAKSREQRTSLELDAIGDTTAGVALRSLRAAAAPLRPG